MDIGTRLVAHADRVAALQRGDNAAPINVEIDLSNRCNLGCRWCAFREAHSAGPYASRRSVETGDVMPADLARHILSDLESAGVRSVTWSGGGEPLTNRDAIRIIEATDLPQGLYTNGTLIDGAVLGGYWRSPLWPVKTFRLGPIAKVLARHCRWVYVSLDAWDSISYIQAKSSHGFAFACGGVRELVAAGCKVGVGFLLESSTARHATAMVRLAESLRADYVQFRPAVRWSPEARGKLRGSEDWAASFVAPQSDRIEVKCDARFAQYATWRGHGYDRCTWCGLQCVITPDGRVWACCDTRGVADALLGDLREESFQTVWARRRLRTVDGSCRVLCHGHKYNLALQPRVDKEFV